MKRALPQKQKILVMGVGNLLMGDEGVGVHIVRRLAEASVAYAALPPQAELLDGGTGGFHLLSYLADYPAVVMVDATLDRRPPGTVTLTRPSHAAHFPGTLSAHDIGLRDLVESAELLGHLPAMSLVTVSIAGYPEMGLELSPEIEAAIPEAIAMIQTAVRNEAKSLPP